MTAAFTGGGLVGAKYGFARLAQDPDGVTGRGHSEARHAELRSDKAPAYVTGRFTPEEVAYPQDLYDAKLVVADRIVGELLDALERHGILERALVVVISDHGEEFDEHGAIGRAHGSHAEIARVALVAPGHLPAGRRIASVRSAEWAAVGRRGDDRASLYDAAADREERDDLGADHPDVLVRLLTQIGEHERAHVRPAHPAPVEREALRGEEAEKLGALGHLQ